MDSGYVHAFQTDGISAGAANEVYVIIMMMTAGAVIPA